jgi:hypothetical protein
LINKSKSSRKKCGHNYLVNDVLVEYAAAATELCHAITSKLEQKDFDSDVF